VPGCRGFSASKQARRLQHSILYRVSRPATSTYIIRQLTGRKSFNLFVTANNVPPYTKVATRVKINGEDAEDMFLL